MSTPLGTLCLGHPDSIFYMKIPAEIFSDRPPGKPPGYSQIFRIVSSNPHAACQLERNPG